MDFWSQGPILGGPAVHVVLRLLTSSVSDLLHFHAVVCPRCSKYVHGRTITVKTRTAARKMNDFINRERMTTVTVASSFSLQALQRSEFSGTALCGIGITHVLQ